MFLPPPTRATILDLQLMVSQSSGRRVRELKSGILHSLTRTNLQQWKGDFKSSEISEGLSKNWSAGPIEFTICQFYS